VYKCLYIFIRGVIDFSAMIYFLLLPLALFGATLEEYKPFLEQGTYNEHDWSFWKKRPESRYETFKTAFEHFAKGKGRIIVELGTSRSFVDGKYPGCNCNETHFWNPKEISKWDWGAGMFTYVAADVLGHLNPEFHTVDLMRDHIGRCRHMTKPFERFMHYHVRSSERFLKHWPKRKKIDLLYLDTGDISPVEPTAMLHLREAKIIVARNLLADDGIILIDDVRHPVPIKLDGDQTGLGKAKYSIPYFLKNGFELIQDEFQIILRKVRASTE